MCRCAAWNVRLCVLIRTVKINWLLTADCWLLTEKVSFVSHHLVVTWWRGKSQRPQCHRMNQTSHRLATVTDGVTECICTVSEPTESPPLRHCAHSVRQRRRRYTQTGCRCESDNESSTHQLSHSLHLTTQTSRRSQHRRITFSSPAHLSTVDVCVCP